MAQAKTAISLDSTLMKRAESLARKKKVSRSRLFALALEEYLRRQENKQILEQINEACQDGPDAQEKKLLRSIGRAQRRQVEGQW